MRHEGTEARRHGGTKARRHEGTKARRGRRTPNIEHRTSNSQHRTPARDVGSASADGIATPGDGVAAGRAGAGARAAIGVNRRSSGGPMKRGTSICGGVALLAIIAFGADRPPDAPGAAPVPAAAPSMTELLKARVGNAARRFALASARP